MVKSHRYINKHAAIDGKQCVFYAAGIKGTLYCRYFSENDPDRDNRQLLISTTVYKYNKRRFGQTQDSGL